jgi:hypothetical protein
MLTERFTFDFDLAVFLIGVWNRRVLEMNLDTDSIIRLIWKITFRR